MVMRDKLQALIAQLRLHGIAAVLDAEIERAEHEAIAAPELLYRLLSQEAAFRQERSLAYRLRQAHLPWRWSLETFPFDRQPGVSKAQIQTLVSRITLSDGAASSFFDGLPASASRLL